ncbi:AraC family transcriptional regulator [Compostibacter hankyongensis]|uniref:AraC family transcriptional regulator n=2 Tax=Compostibacter hankyongensis TaxID=1007089 RepID=A0ABP8FBM5_9BACT
MKTQKVKTISEFHRLRGLPPPEHPLISVVDYAKIVRQPDLGQVRWVNDFYHISVKRGVNAKLRYGQQAYDFDEGVMFFIAPAQVFSIEEDSGPATGRSGWMLLIHPDFLWNTALAKNIRRYEYFDYAVNEALFLSEKEEETVSNIVAHIQQECHANIDKFSKQIIISHVETLLSYAERFYHRQFITRERSSHQLLSRLEELLTDHFNNEEIAVKGLPTVQYISGRLNVSPRYLSSLLKTLTGQSAQQHIHNKLIEKAKERLSVTELSVSEIAYALGFGHPQSFSKLFKTQTGQTPLAFRAKFN